jgi:hypothetical protein
MPRPKALDKLTIGQIQQILDRKMSHLQDLQERRRELSNQLGDVDREIRRLQGGLGGRKVGLGSFSRGPRRRRLGRNQRPLREFVKEALGDNRKGMRPKDITEAVRKAGYRTSSTKPYLLVHQALGHLVKAGHVIRDESTRTYRLAKE